MQKPNIIYILADDMGYGDLSCLNENAAFTTPHLDKMCQEGMYHTDATQLLPFARLLDIVL